MKHIITYSGILLLLFLFSGCTAVGAGQGPAEAQQIKLYSVSQGGYIMMEKVNKSPQEWKKILSAEQYKILRKKGTERAFSGEYDSNHAPGIYTCTGCGSDLFRSDDKFDSGTGWPSFTGPVAPENIRTAPDNSLFTRRTEVLCSRCDGHLGHVFEDGPEPSGLRYCINSIALTFRGSE